jgi:outer membrane lipoprotein-sorting protein
MTVTMKRYFGLIMLFLVLTASGLWANSDQPDTTALLQQLDRMTNFSGDFTAEYTEVAEHPGQQPSVFRHDVYRRDKDGAMTILMRYPDSKKGQGYLQVDNNFWFYDPSSRLFSHASLKENWQNTGAMNNDFFRTSWARDYVSETSNDGTLGAYPVHVLDLKGTNDQVTFPYKKVWIRKDIGILLKAEDYSLSKRLMRTVYYPQYVKLDDHYVANRVLIIDNLNIGARTELSLANISTAPLPDYTFTKAYLQQVNR